MYKHLKKATAIMLSGALLVSAIFAGTQAFASSANIDGYYYEEDFSLKDLSDWEERNSEGLYSVVDTSDGNALMFDYNKAEGGKPYILGLKSGKIPTSGIEEAVYTVKFSKVPTLYGGLEIVYDYKNKDNYKFVNIGSFGTLGWFKRDNSVSDGVITNGATGQISTEIDFTDWVKVSIGYNNGKANIVIKQNDKALTLSYATDTTPVVLSNYRANGNESSVMYYKKISVYYGGYSQILADQYTVKHKAILNKTLQSITSADKEAIDNALNDYSLLSTSYQNEYYKYIALLNGFLEKINAGDGYDDTLYTNMANWTVLKGSLNSSNFNIDKDGIISLSSNVMLKLNPASYLKENQIAKQFSYKIKYSKGNSGGSGIRYVYSYTDSSNYLYNAIWHDDIHGFFNQLWQCAGGVEKSTGTAYAQEIGDLNGWLDVTIDLTETGKYSYTLSRTDGDKVYSFSTTYNSELTELILYANAECQIKDISVSCYNEDDVTLGEKEVKLFKKNNAEILSLTAQMVPKNSDFKRDVEAAIADYETNLSYFAKFCLVKQYELLKSLLAAVNAASGEYSQKPDFTADSSGKKYYDWSDDFENGLGKWSNSIASSTAKVSVPRTDIIEDAVDTGNHAVSVTQHGFIYPSSYTIPEKAQLSQVKFRVKLADNTKFYVNKPLTIMLSYVNSDNWQALEIYGMAEGEVMLSYRFSKCVDGVYSAGYHYSGKVTIVDYYNQWIDVTLTYESDGSKVAVQVESGKMLDMYSQTLTAAYGQFALWSQSGYNWLYDDVSIRYVEGTWEENQKIDSIYPYFSGNTEYFPDDVLTVYGENINDTVTKVECVHISDEAYRQALIADAAGADKKFLPEISYSSGKQTGSFVVAATDASWDNTTAVKLKMLQPSVNSFKVILPTTDADGNAYSGGVYALKLHGTDATGAKDAIIYINNPVIDYVNCDDGDHATPGGQLRVIGENLALYYDEVDKKDFIVDSEEDIAKLNNAVSSNKYKVYVRVVNADYDRVFSTSDGSVTIQSRNSLIVDLPSDISLGDYEVSIYNGYGDFTCWSAPCNVKVDNDVRSGWNQTVYDITNYGAIASDSDQNITSILMNAIQSALDKTGGGIIYIPRGRYKLIYGIVIPEGIQLVGDGSDQTILYWEPFQWKIKSCPPFILAFSSNISISGIGFYGTRGTCLFRSYGGHNTQTSTDYNKNIFFNDVRIQFMPLEGVVTGGSGTGINSSEGINAITQELNIRDAYGIYVQNPYNVNFKNIELKRDGVSGNDVGQPLVLDYGKYVNISGGLYENGWMHGNLNNFIFEYTKFASATLGFQGDNCYYHGCTINNRTINNRELFVADGSPASNGGSTAAVITLATQEECDKYGYTYGYTYRVISGWSEQHDCIQLYVRTGQGIGQTRLTTSYQTKYSYDSSGKSTQVKFVTISEPFVVAPNSNSRVVARTPRENMYFDYMFYNNGCATGYFGGFADTVYDNCVWKQVTDIYFDSYNADLNWYLSMVNGTFYDAYNLHDTGSSQWFTDYGSIIFTSQNSSGATSPTCCVRFYGNNLDGYQLYARSAFADGIRDIVVQKNEWDNSITAITGTGGARESGADGLFIYKNSVNDVTTFLKTTYTGSNSVGSKRVINFTVGDYNGFAVGDVNADGSITLKDATLIKYYISGEIVFSDDQIKRADFYSDNNVNLKDAVAIKYYITTGEILLEGGGETSSESSSSAESDTVSSGGSGYYDDIV